MTNAQTNEALDDDTKGIKKDSMSNNLDQQKLQNVTMLSEFLLQMS